MNYSKRLRLRALLGFLSAILAVASPASATQPVTDAHDPLDATACAVWDTSEPMECFASETELLQEATSRGSSRSSSLCSSALRLYDGTGYGGAVLYVYERGTWINLSSYGWSNRASSFKVGACSSYLADGSSGGGSWYPTYLSEAWDQSSNMLAWSNRVSSVYLK